MRQLTRNVFVETGIRGCNHGFVTTSDGIVMIDSPHKPSDALKLKAEIARRGGRLRYIIKTEPHGDHWTGNAFFDAPVVAHEGVRKRILETNLAEQQRGQPVRLHDRNMGCPMSARMIAGKPFISSPVSATAGGARRSNPNCHREAASAPPWRSRGARAFRSQRDCFVKLILAMTAVLFVESLKHEQRSMRWLFAAIFHAAALVMASNASAAYPDRPLRYIVPQAPGSASDTSARIIAFELTRILGQQVVVDNRPGGGLTIGIDMVVRASPDGYTIGYGNIGGLAINRSILPKVPYDSLKDVQPIAQTNTGNQLLAVTNALPVKSVRELIDYAKANPGKLLNGSSGNGTPGHLAGELFKQMANVSIMHVPYKGGAQAMTEMMTGQVQLIFESTSSIAAHHRSGRLRGIAVTGLKRTPSFPDIPTIAESGVPGYDVTVWAGLITPVGVSKAVIAKLNDAVNKAMVSPALMEKYAANGVETVRSTPEEFGALIKREVEKYAALAKTLKTKVD